MMRKMRKREMKRMVKVERVEEVCKGEEKDPWRLKLNFEVDFS